jgi:Lon-like ATP-dependent protease
MHTPAQVAETIEDELLKLSTLEKNSSEFNVTRSYLDWLTQVGRPTGSRR